MSNRALSADMIAAMMTGVMKPIFLYVGEFTGGTVRLFTGFGTLTGAAPWDAGAHTWTGDAGLMQISNVQEVSELQAVNFTVSLNGDVSSLFSLVHTQVRRGQLGEIWFGLINPAGALVNYPYLTTRGRADMPDMTPDVAHAVVSVTYESRLIDADRVKQRRYTSEDQHIDYPADLGFDFVPAVQEMVIPWNPR